MTAQQRDLLRGQAAGLRRLGEHILRGSATPGQIAQALAVVEHELKRIAAEGEETPGCSERP